MGKKIGVFGAGAHEVACALIGNVGDHYAFVAFDAKKAAAANGEGSGVPLDPASFERGGPTDFPLNGKGNCLGYARNQDAEGEQ